MTATLNNERPTVSVIIPCYRQGRFLAAAVKSVLSQSHGAVEVIVVDDGSDDNTGEVAQSFGERVRYIRQANAGPAAARNNGIGHATGKYLMFVDSDDILHPDAVKWLVDAAQGRENALCIMGVRCFERDEDLESGILMVPPRPAAMGRHMLAYNINPPVACLCSREMVQKAGGFDPALKVTGCEDWELWTRLVFAGAELVPVYKIGAYYREHPNSHSKNALRMARARSEVLWRTFSHVQAHPETAERFGIGPKMFTNEIRRNLAGEYMDVAYMNREKGDYREALRNYWRAATRGRSLFRGMMGIAKLAVYRLRSKRKPEAPTGGAVLTAGASAS